MVKTYAWRNAIKSSRAVSALTKASGSIPAAPSNGTNPAKTLRRVCPASIFANKRMARLIGRDKYDIISMGIMSGHIQIGTPGGTNNEKKWIPCLASPKRVTPVKTTIAIANVTAMWLVKVKLYGSIPSIFPKRINMKSVKIKGKYLRPSLPTVSRIRLATNW